MGKRIAMNMQCKGEMDKGGNGKGWTVTLTIIGDGNKAEMRGTMRWLHQITMNDTHVIDREFSPHGPN
jgi:hypothetical protein